MYLFIYSHHLKVYTGVCLIFNGEHEITFFEETKVQFSKLSKELIQAYIKTGEPLDKAGNYLNIKFYIFGKK